MQPIRKVTRPDGIIELTVVEEKKFFYFFRRKVKTTFLGKPKTFMKSETGKKPKTYDWYKKNDKVSANDNDILSVLAEFYNID